jgi:hypothetical protein
MRRRRDSVGSHYYFNYKHLRMVVQSFIHLGRSSKLEIFKNRRGMLYSLLWLQKRKKRNSV